MSLLPIPTEPGIKNANLKTVHIAFDGTLKVWIDNGFFYTLSTDSAVVTAANAASAGTGKLVTSIKRIPYDSSATAELGADERYTLYSNWIEVKVNSKTYIINPMWISNFQFA